MTHIARLIRTDPEKARAELAKLFKKHRTRVAVAKSEDVPVSTLTRWIRQIKAAGLTDPRLDDEGEARPGVRGPRVQRSDLLARAKREPAKVRRELAAILKPRQGEGARQARVRAAGELGCNEITIRRVLAFLDDR